MSKDKAVSQTAKSRESLTAYFLHFIYYLSKGYWKRGVGFLIVSAILPKYCYFIIGLFAGFWLDNSEVKQEKVKIKNIVVACLGVLLFCVLKYVRVMFLHSL